MKEKNNALDYYFDDLNRCKPLSQDEINDKVREIDQTVDNETIDKLRAEIAESHLKLVIKVAKDYQCSGLSLADLVQEGNIGLMKAIEKYDPNQNLKFNTLAVWWIKETILRAIKYNNKLIRTPTYVQEALARIQKVRSSYEKEHGTDPPLSYLAELENMSEADLEVLMNVTMEPVSIESIVHAGEAKSLKDFIPDPSVDLNESVETYKLVSSIQYVLDTHLTPSEKEVMILRYGLFNETAHTLEESAARMNKSREHIRQLDDSAKKKLKLNAPWLQEFLV